MINIHSIKKNNSIYKYICLPLLHNNYNKELKKIIIIFLFTGISFPYNEMFVLTVITFF